MIELRRDHRGDGSVARVRRRSAPPPGRDGGAPRRERSARRRAAPAARAAKPRCSSSATTASRCARPNGRFLLVPHLRLQTVYEGRRVARGSWTTAAPDRSGFALPHAEVILDGHVGSRLFSYRLQLDAAQSPTIRDAYMQIGRGAASACASVSSRFPYGSSAGPTAASWSSSPSRRRWPAFALDRDIGLMATGRPFAGRLEYELVRHQRVGGGPPNDNIDLAYAARIVAAPWGR